MKKIALILNHTQAGMGSDENAMLPPNGKRSPLGTGEILNPMFKELDCEIVATLFCGDQYYLAHPEEVQKKFIGFCKKFDIDAVLCGPAMQYPNFGEMSAQLAMTLEKYDIPASASMAIENPAVDTYKDQVTIIKMPKKGGIGLQDSFRHMAQITARKAKHESFDDLKEYIF